MNKNELLQVMDEMLTALDQLRDAAFKKQRALIENSFERIDSAVKDEEKYLAELQTIHKKRVAVLDSMSIEFSLKVNSRKFGDFLEAIAGMIDNDYYEELSQRNYSLGILLGNVNLLNLQNSYLTEQARSFNRSLINELFANKNKSILDRKV